MQDCKATQTESKGDSSGKRSDKAVIRQIATRKKKRKESDDPIAYLHSSSDEEHDVKLVQEPDGESQPWCVQVQGVNTWRILDTGADITIMGPDLFKEIAS